jgi:TrmH family RNA methyltransferase
MFSANDVKYYGSLKQKKYREKENKFLIEGFHLVEECLNSSFEIECVIISENAERKKEKRIFDVIYKKKISLYALKEKSFNKLTETETSQGIVAVVKQKKPAQLSSLQKENLIVALDRITDPGNLGTIIRTAYWFGADAVLISESSVDVYNSKVIRSTQGALFHVRIIYNLKLTESLIELNKSGFNVYLLDVNAESTLETIDKKRRSVFLFGNEAEGISVDLLESGFELVKIKGYSGCESLNVAVSCGIVLNEFKSPR